MPISNRLYRQGECAPRRHSLPWRQYFRNILAKDTVLWASLILAAASFAVAGRAPASSLEYIDFRTLACLACLMTASGGFMISGVFDWAAARLTNRCRGQRSLSAAMVFCTFFASMLVTNDVALLVFVPTTLLCFRKTGLDPVATVVLQTLAANVGSIALPMGNPQNLYLYSRYQMAFGPFLRTVLPLSLAGAALLALCCLLMKNRVMECPRTETPVPRRGDIALYAALFVIAALATFGLIDHRLALVPTVAVLLIKGRDLAQQVDYALLLTFVGFFLFVGNVSHLPAVETALRSFVEPRPFAAAVLASQVVSNVPAAIMLSGFTEDGGALLAGVSAGGCGTLIASMASLISYKLLVRAGGGKARFLVVFTLLNVLFLAAMVAAYWAGLAA